MKKTISAVRPTNTLRNWEVWSVVVDEDGKESWGRKVETVRTKTQARELVAELNGGIL